MKVENNKGPLTPTQEPGSLSVKQPSSAGSTCSKQYQPVNGKKYILLQKTGDNNNKPLSAHTVEHKQKTNTAKDALNSAISSLNEKIKLLSKKDIHSCSSEDIHKIALDNIEAIQSIICTLVNSENLSQNKKLIDLLTGTSKKLKGIIDKKKNNITNYLFPKNQEINRLKKLKSEVTSLRQNLELFLNEGEQLQNINMSQGNKKEIAKDRKKTTISKKPNKKEMEFFKKINTYNFFDQNIKSLLQNLETVENQTRTQTLQKLHDYINYNIRALENLRPSLECLLALDPHNKIAQSLLDIQNKLNLFPSMNETSLLTEDLFNKITTIDANISSLAVFNRNRTAYQQIFNNSMPKKQEPQDLMKKFCCLLLKNSFKEQPKMLLTEAKGIFSKINKHLSDNTPLSLYSFVMSKPKKIESMLATLDSNEELHCFLCAYNQYLTQSGIQDRMNMIQQKIDTLDKNNNLASHAISQTKEALKAKNTLTEINKQLCKKTNSSDFDHLRNQCAQSINHVNKWTNNANTFNEVQSAIDDQKRIFETIANNKIKMLDKLKKIKNDLFININSNDKNLDHKSPKSNNWLFNNKKSNTDLLALNTKKLAQIVDLINVLSTSESSIEKNEQTLNKATNKCLKLLLDGCINQHECEDLLCTIYCSQNVLLIGTKEKDNVTKEEIKSLNVVKRSLSLQAEFLANEEIKLMKQPFLKFNKKLKVRLNSIKEDKLKSERIFCSINILMQNPVTKKSLIDALNLLKEQTFVYGASSNYYRQTVKLVDKALSTLNHPNVSHAKSPSETSYKENIAESVFMKDNVLEPEKWPIALGHNVSALKRILHNKNTEQKKNIAINKNDDYLKTLHIAHRTKQELMSMLTIFSVFDSETQQNNKKKIESDISDCINLFDQYLHNDHSQIEIMMLVTQFLKISEQLKVIITKRNLILADREPAPLTQGCLNKMLNIVNNREDFIAGHINNIAHLETAIKTQLNNKKENTDNVIATMNSLSELKNSLAHDFSISVGTDENNSPTKKIIKKLNSLSKNNRWELSSFIIAMEDLFNKRINDILNNTGEADSTTIVRRTLLQPLNKEKNNQKNIDNVKKMLFALSDSFLGKYFDIDLDSMAVSAKAASVTDKEIQSFYGNDTNKCHDPIMQHKFKIYTHLTSEPVSSYDLGLFIEQLKALASSDSAIRHEAKYCLENAPTTWPSLFQAKNGENKYTHTEIKRPDITDSLTNNMIALQQGLFFGLWGKPLPVKEMATFRNQEQSHLINTLNDHKLKEKQEKTTKLLENLKLRILKDNLVMNKKAKLLVIQEAIQQINNRKSLNGLVDTMCQACKKFEKTIPFYNLKDNKYHILLAHIMTDQYSLPTNKHTLKAKIKAR